MLKNDLISTLPTEIVTDELIRKLQTIDISRATQVSISWNSLFGHDNQLAWKKLIERDFFIPLKTLNLFEQYAKLALGRAETSWYESAETILSRPLAYSFKDVYHKLKRVAKFIIKKPNFIHYLYSENHLSLLALCTGNADISKYFISDKGKKYFADISVYFDCPHVFSYLHEPKYDVLGCTIKAKSWHLMYYLLTSGRLYRDPGQQLDRFYLFNEIVKSCDQRCIQLIIQDIGLKELPKDNLYYCFINALISNENISLSFIYKMLLKKDQLDLPEIYCHLLLLRLKADEKVERNTKMMIILLMINNNYPIDYNLLSALADLDLNYAKQLIQKYKFSKDINTKMFALAHKMDCSDFIKKFIQYQHQSSFLFKPEMSLARYTHSYISTLILNDILPDNNYQLFEYLLDEKNYFYISRFSSDEDKYELLKCAAMHQNNLFFEYLLIHRKRLNLTPNADILLSAIYADRASNFKVLLDPELGIQPTIEHLEAAVCVNTTFMIDILVHQFKLMPTQPILDMACRYRPIRERINSFMLPSAHIIRHLLDLNPELQISKLCFFEEKSYECVLSHFISKFTFSPEELETLIKLNKFKFVKHILQNQADVFPTVEMVKIAINCNEFDFAQFLLQEKYGLFNKDDSLFSLAITHGHFKIAKLLSNPQFNQKLNPDNFDFVRLVKRRKFRLAEKLIRDKFIPLQTCLSQMYDDWRLNITGGYYSFSQYKFVFEIAINNKFYPDKKLILKILESGPNLMIVRMLLNPIFGITLKNEDGTWDSPANFENQRCLLYADIAIRDCFVHLKNTNFKRASESFSLSHERSPMQCLRVAYFALANPSVYKLNEKHLSMLIDFIEDVGRKHFYTIPECVTANQYLVEAVEHLRENGMPSLADRLDAITFYIKNHAFDAAVPKCAHGF